MVRLSASSEDAKSTAIVPLKLVISVIMTFDIESFELSDIFVTAADEVSYHMIEADLASL